MWLDLVRKMSQRGIRGVGRNTPSVSEKEAPGGLGQGCGTSGMRASCSRARAEVGAPATRIQTHTLPYTSVLVYKHGDTDNISVADKSLAEVEPFTLLSCYMHAAVPSKTKCEKHWYLFFMH